MNERIKYAQVFYEEPAREDIDLEALGEIWGISGEAESMESLTIDAVIDLLYVRVIFNEFVFLPESAGGSHREQIRKAAADSLDFVYRFKRSNFIVENYEKLQQFNEYDPASGLSLEMFAAERGLGINLCFNIFTNLTKTPQGASDSLFPELKGEKT